MFPCVPEGKEPLTVHGFLDASTDPRQIRSWWSRWPQANIAIPTGASTADVLDVDVRSAGNGWAAFNRLQRAGLLAGAVRLVVTPSTGLHMYFPGTTQPSSKITGAFVDFKGEGGYVLVPPSYVVTPDYAGRYVELDARPAGRPLDWAAVRRLLAPPATRMTRLRAERARDMDVLVRWVEQLPEGNRNHGLFWAACRAVEGGRTDLEDLATAAVEAGLTPREAARTIASAVRTTGGCAR